MTSRFSPARFLATLVALSACAAIAAGCGNDVPPSAVAKVGDSTISKDEFNRWLKNAASGMSQSGGDPVIPDPPDYKKCIAGLKDQPKPKGAGKKSQSTPALKKQCKQQYDQLKGEVMQFLIQAEWVQQEAKKRKVTISDAEVDKAFAQQKSQAFPKEAAYKKFLKQSGMTEKDIFFRVRLDSLQTKLTKKVTEGDTKVSDADVQAFYDKNRKQFDKPESRDVDLVLTKDKAKADQAKSEIEGGASFKNVSKKYSIDEQTKGQGGKLKGLTKGQQDKDLEKAAFGAKKDQLEGPVKTEFGYYVFRVTKVTAKSTSSLAKVKDQVRQQLKSQRQQKALDKFVKSFRSKYKKQTKCAKDFRVAECENAPKGKSDASGAAPGGATPAPGGGATPAAPQGAAPQGATPQAPQGGATPTAPTAPQGGGAQAPAAPAPAAP